MCFFFFSSRRRHTRYWRDWSSDVCSSDLGSVVVFELSTTCGTDYPGQLLRTVTVDAEPTPLYRDLHDVASACLDAIVGGLRPGSRRWTTWSTASAAATCRRCSAIAGSRPARTRHRWRRG